MKPLVYINSTVASAIHAVLGILHTPILCIGHGIAQKCMHNLKSITELRLQTCANVLAVLIL